MVPRWLPAFLQRLFGRLSHKAFRRWTRLRGIRLLSADQTAERLRAYEVFTRFSRTIELPDVPHATAGTPLIFGAQRATSEATRVWCYTGQAARQLPYGSIRLNREVLCTDANTADYGRNGFRAARQAVHVPTLLAPWSHYLDGTMWGGYYDFVIIVVAKLCRMKDALPQAFAEGTVAYPLFGTPYEREYHDLLGLRPGQVLDSRDWNVSFDRCVLGNLGDWFYPNIDDLLAVRRHITARVPLSACRNERLYISRSGRRRVRNEAELVELLREFDFRIVEDRPRSVAEQMDLYSGASFILGPHGASFTNILWCHPGTYLLELFAPTYVPDFFRYMAEALGLRYGAYHFGTRAPGDWAQGLTDDLDVAVPALRKCLSQLLSPAAVPD
jgi:hypothetical protein